MKDTAAILMAILILLFLPLAIYMHFNADCDSAWFAFSKASELPARCVTYYQK